MGDVIRFPRCQRRHWTASARARPERVAARSAKVLKESPAVCATGESTIVCHHEAGIRSRCHHLLTIRELTSNSAAMASRVPQSSTTLRNDSMGMEDCIRPFVLKCKTTLSHDAAFVDGFNQYVGKTEHKETFLARVKAARERRGHTQEEMAEVLGMKQTKYHKYESRSYLPHDLVPRFCLACGISIHWLYTGRNQSTSKEEVPIISKGSKTGPTRTKTG